MNTHHMHHHSCPNTYIVQPQPYIYRPPYNPEIYPQQNVYNPPIQYEIKINDHLIPHHKKNHHHSDCCIIV